MILKANASVTFYDRRTLAEREAARKEPADGNTIANNPEPPFYMERGSIKDAPDWVASDWGFAARLKDGSIKDLTPPKPVAATAPVADPAKPKTALKETSAA